MTPRQKTEFMDDIYPQEWIAKDWEKREERNNAKQELS
jgi:hypothetical protein